MQQATTVAAVWISNKFVDQMFEYVKEPLFWIFGVLCVVGIIYSLIHKDDDNDPFQR